MSVEQRITESEPEFRKHVVDKVAFKARLFQTMDEERFPAKKRFLTQKKTLVVSFCIAAPLFGTIAGATVYKWSTTWDGHIQATTAGATDAAVAYIAPFWQPGYLDSRPQMPISFVGLRTAKEKAEFPIKEPSAIPGWTNVFSTGYVEGKGMPLNYVDVYQAQSGARVSVVQRKFGNPSQHTILNYPQGAQKLASFSPDLAVHVSGVVDEQARVSANELDVYHNNADHSVTQFVIAGEVPEQTLETFAKAYFQAPGD